MLRLNHFKSLSDEALLSRKRALDTGLLTSDWTWEELEEYEAIEEELLYRQNPIEDEDFDWE